MYTSFIQSLNRHSNTVLSSDLGHNLGKWTETGSVGQLDHAFSYMNILTTHRHASLDILMVLGRMVLSKFYCISSIFISTLTVLNCIDGSISLNICITAVVSYRVLNLHSSGNAMAWNSIVHIPSISCHSPGGVTRPSGDGQSGYALWCGWEHLAAVPPWEVQQGSDLCMYHYIITSWDDITWHHTVFVFISDLHWRDPCGY